MGVQRTPVNVNVSRGVLWWHSPPNAPMLSQNQKGFQGSIKSLQATAAAPVSRTIIESMDVFIAFLNQAPAAVPELTSEVIRQRFFQDFFAGFFHGLLPSSTRSNNATNGLPLFCNEVSYVASSYGLRSCQQRQMMRCHLKASARTACYAARLCCAVRPRLLPSRERLLPHRPSCFPW